MSLCSCDEVVLTKVSIDSKHLLRHSQVNTCERDDVFTPFRWVFAESTR